MGRLYSIFHPLALIELKSHGAIHQINLSQKQAVTR